MKKVRRSGSSRKSRSSSKSSFSGRSSSKTGKTRSSGSSFFSRKRRKTASMEKPRKPHKSAGEKDIFIKPPNDPGPKHREESGDLFIKPPNDPGSKIPGEETEILQEYVEEGDGGGVIQQALQNTGCGCCSSITGLIWFMAIGTLAVIILLIVKCGGC